MSTESPAANVFLSYAHGQDDLFRDELARHLMPLERQGLIRLWNDRKIPPGAHFGNEIHNRLEQADIILLLISADFFASDYCCNIEMKRALERDKAGEAIVIPVILKAVDWMDSPVGELQALPPNGNPVMSYPDRDEAYSAITDAIAQLKVHRTGHSVPEPKLPAMISPVDESCPLILAVAIDVSRSMQTPICDSADKKTRLQAVMQGIKDLTMAPPSGQTMAGMIRIFAYGFGFRDRTPISDSPIRPLPASMLSSTTERLREMYRGSVRNLFEIAGLGRPSLFLKELGDRWPEFESGLWAQEIEFYGGTPMKSAMDMISDQFANELAVLGNAPHSALLIISDGESTDGSPVEACQEMKSSGTTVLAGYVTGDDVAEQYVLYAAAPQNWPTSAKALFECSSALSEARTAVTILQNQGWRATHDSRLFVQLNQSEMLSHFISLVLSLPRDRARLRAERA